MLGLPQVTEATGLQTSHLMAPGDSPQPDLQRGVTQKPRPSLYIWATVNVTDTRAIVKGGHGILYRD